MDFLRETHMDPQAIDITNRVRCMPCRRPGEHVDVCGSGSLDRVAFVQKSHVAASNESANVLMASNNATGNLHVVLEFVEEICDLVLICVGSEVRYDQSTRNGCLLLSCAVNNLIF